MSLTKTRIAVVIAFLFVALTGCLIGLVGSIEREPKDCLDYTLKEYREGDAPAKCQAEVYGDQF